MLYFQELIADNDHFLFLTCKNLFLNTKEKAGCCHSQVR